MLRFVFDEDVARWLANAIRRHNVGGVSIDFLAVGEFGGPPKQTQDPELLCWSEAEDRLIVSRDVRTLPTHLAHHLAAGHHCPGILFIRPGFPVAAIIDALELIAHAGGPDEFRDGTDFIP